MRQPKSALAVYSDAGNLCYLAVHYACASTYELIVELPVLDLIRLIIELMTKYKDTKLAPEANMSWQPAAA
jgi:hypothetical protein